jgi:hypothetical protein
MVIILILLGVAGIYGGLWLKRRYQRKDDIGEHKSTLMVDEAANALRNRHPESPSMVELPPSSRNLDREFMSGAISPVGARDAVGGHRDGQGKGKSRAHESKLREVTNSLTDEAGDSSLGRSGSRPKSKSSSKRSRSRRER